MSRDLARQVLRTEAEAILRLAERLDDRFEAAVELILKARGRVMVSGMGKSGIVAKKIAATLASTGTPAYFLHPSEAVHGDLGMLVDGDVALLLSNSGETPELVRLVELIQRLSLRSIAFVGTGESTLARAVDVAIDCGIEREACPLNLAPSASTTAAMAMGDALALALAAGRGFTAEDFAARHPGGRLGRRLLRVGDLMHTGAEVPRVLASTPLAEAIQEMTEKGRGMTTVVDDEGCLVGVLTDGDLRRALAKAGSIEGRTAGSIASRDPKTIGRDEAAARALARMEEWSITSLVVVDADRRVEGLLHIHQLWRLEMF